MIVYYSPWTHRSSVSEREPQGWIMNWMIVWLLFSQGALQCFFFSFHKWLYLLPLSVQVANCFQAEVKGGAAEEGGSWEQSSDPGGEAAEEEQGGLDLYSSHKHFVYSHLMSCSSAFNMCLPKIGTAQTQTIKHTWSLGQDWEHDVRLKRLIWSLSTFSFSLYVPYITLACVHPS